MSHTLLVALLAGGIAGVGVVVLVAGIRGLEPDLSRGRRLGDGIEQLPLRLALAAGGGLVVAVITRWPVGTLMVAALGFAAPKLFGGKAARRADIERVEAIAAWTEMLRDTMAAAAGIEQAISATASVAPKPIRAEVTMLAARLGGRERLPVALREFAEALHDPMGDLVVAALLLSSEREARYLGALLGTLADSTREQATMRSRVEASRSGIQTEVKAITAVAVIFGLGMILLNREYLDAYDDGVGQGILAVVGVLFFVAFTWLASAAKGSTPERFLAQQGPRGR